MKIRIYPFLFVAAISFLISVICYKISLNNFKLLYTYSAFLSNFMLLFFMLAVKFNDVRTGINVKTCSTLFITLNILLLYMFGSINSTRFSFVIVISFLFLIYLGILYFITQKEV